MYYIQINSFEKNLEDGLIYEGDLYIKIQYNELIRTTTTKWEDNSHNWNEIFLFEDEPISIKIYLMDNEIKKEGELPINRANDLLEISFNDIKMKHGFIHIESLLDHSNTIKDIELDKNEIFYLKSVVDDKDKIIEEKTNTIKKYTEREEERSIKINTMNEEKTIRDDLIMEMGDKFKRIKDIMNE